MVSGTLVILAVVVIALGYILFKRRDKNSPPGPPRLPLVGNLHQLDPMLHLVFEKWAKKYGEIFRVDFATTKNIVMSDHKLVKEVFADSTFSGRPDFRLFDFMLDGKLHGVINTEGEHWEEIRRFTLRQLRDFGFGKNTMEDAIMMEANEFIDRIKKHGDKPVENVKQMLFLAVVNALWNIVTGKRYNHDDKELIEMTETANESFNKLFESNPAILFIPWLAEYFPKLMGYEEIKEQILILAKFFWKPIEEHKKTYDEDYQRDFMDSFIREIKKTTNPNSAFYDKLGYENLCATLGDLYFAGTDTTSTTLSWMCLYLSRMPHIQKRLQEEIESITGNSRQVSISDRPNMPYTEALIAETMRYSSITPQGVAHKALRDATIRGYKIEKDSMITPNVYYIHFNPSIWGDPMNFRPERFLSEDGKVFKKNDALMPFSIGRRQCLGETLARDNLFLFATNIFQRFTVEFDSNGPDHGFDSKPGFLLNPKPFHVKFKDRVA